MYLAILILAMVLYIFNRKNLALCAIPFFITNGFQLVDNYFNFLPIEKGEDFALLFMFFLLFFTLNNRNRKRYQANIFDKLIILFLSFVFIEVIYNIIIIKVPLVEIFRTVRLYLFILFYYVIRDWDEKTLQIVLSVIVNYTFITSLIYISQYLFNQKILLGSETILTVNYSFGSQIRFYNYPPFIFLTYLIVINKKANFVNLLILLTLFIAINYTQQRTLLLTVLLISLLKITLNNRKQLYIVLPVVGIILTTFSKERIIQAFNDLKNLPHVFSNYSVFADDNFSYRLAHFWERFIYLAQSWETLLFGAGLYTEDSKLNTILKFSVGVVSEVTKSTSQFDSNDMSYSNLILRLGLPGTIIFLVYFYQFYRKAIVGTSSSVNFRIFVKFWFLGIVLFSFMSGVLYPGTIYIQLYLVVFWAISKSSKTTIKSIAN